MASHANGAKHLLDAAELREIESDINAALAEHPDNADLQQLLQDARDSRQGAIDEQPVQKRLRAQPHPANELLTQQPDFAMLADKYPDLRAFVKIQAGRVRFTWRNWNATHALAQALLAEYFGVVNWRIPEGRLVPAIPNRLNYLLWINDLLGLSRSSTNPVQGLDVGCGCNLVYPLIGASRFGWHFTAADNDENAIASASAILESNADLKPLIQLRRTACIVQAHRPGEATSSNAGTSRKHPSALACAADSDFFDFCVCNPPFFSEESESGQGVATYGGVSSEMVCEGGEQAFVEAMISDSLMMHTEAEGGCHWYTVMLGKKSTFSAMRRLVNGMGSVTAVRSKELVQGKQSRWVIGWSFSVPRSYANLPLR